MQIAAERAVRPSIHSGMVWIPQQDEIIISSREVVRRHKDWEGKSGPSNPWSSVCVGSKAHPGVRAVRTAHRTLLCWAPWGGTRIGEGKSGPTNGKSSTCIDTGKGSIGIQLHSPSPIIKLLEIIWQSRVVRLIQLNGPCPPRRIKCTVMQIASWRHQAAKGILQQASLEYACKMEE